MTLVIDSSVAVKWFVVEADQEQALAILDQDEELVAPDLLLAEVANSLWRKARGGQITQEQVTKALTELGSLVTLVPVTDNLVIKAVVIASELEHSVYDCIFLACAQERSVPLVTADVKFLNKLASVSRLRNVRSLLA